MSRFVRFLATALVSVALITTTFTPAKAIDLPNILAGSITTKQVDIMADDSTKLVSYVTTPNTTKYPNPTLVVMPGSFASPAVQQNAFGRYLAEHGYLAIGWASRGFSGSGGKMDLAGPRTIKDISNVIDWAEQHTTANTSKVGGYGFSYAGAQVLLAAAHDRRIAAVNSLAGWTDVDRTAYPNETLQSTGAALGFGIARTTSNPDRIYLDTVDKAVRNDTWPSLAEVNKLRSPSSYLDFYNKTQLPIQIHQNYNDLMMRVLPVVDFYNKLTGPKRIYTNPGDHGTYGWIGNVGLTEKTWVDTVEWFDYHLRGVNNNVMAKPAVNAEIANTGSVITGPNWNDLGKNKTTYYAHPPTWFSTPQIVSTGSLKSTQPPSPWHKTIYGSFGTATNSGWPYISSVPLQTTHHAWGSIGILDSRLAALNIQTSAFSAGATLAGTPRVTANVSSSISQGTINVYLTEVSPFGTQKIITHQPYSLRNITPGKQYTITVDLEPIAWKIDPGSSLGVVFSTTDTRFNTLSTLGSTMTLHSSPTTPLALTVPFT